MRLFLTGIALMIAVIAPAQIKPNYSAGLIPKELLPYASAVMRNEEVTVEVKAENNTIYHDKAAITVLNKNGDKFAHIVIFHDKLNTIKNIKGAVYNEFGQQILKFSESNFDDVSVDDGFSLFEDTRVKHFLPAVTDYPYTIEYEYEVHSKQSLNFDDWRPNPYTGTSVEKSKYTFICKPDLNIRYKEMNIPEKAVIATNADGLKTYTWQISNMKAIKDEPLSPNPYTYLSSVKIASEKFTYDGVNGSFTNWNELGKWTYNKLLLNRDQLPPETVAYIRDLTKDIANPKDKARKLYEFMQQKTRYVSVQVGIGGFQPFLASDVDKLSYGDCKALVNYMHSLLKYVNIDSYYCVVNADEDKKTSMLSDFASMQGNHIILCIPFKNDTTWLECTNQKIPFGFLGSFTDDRTVLACTPEGGKLMHTPKYTATDNLQQRNASFIINNDGELSGTMQTLFKGVQYEEREAEIEDAPSDQLKDLKNIYPINNLEIEKFDFKQDKGIQPVTTENIKLSAHEYASVTGNKIYFLVNPVNRLTKFLPDVRNRLTDVYINEGTTDDDEISYTLPKGYHLEKVPLDVTITKPFGNYEATMTIKGDQLVYKRKIQWLDGTYSKDTYHDLVDFYTRVLDADNYSVSLVKNN